MRTRIILALFGLSTICFAQTKLEKTVTVPKGNKLVLLFDYPELIRVRTWDKPDVQIKASVSINRGENDNAFELQIDQQNGETVVSSIIKNKDDLPKYTTIKKGEQEFFFKSGNWNDPEIQKFLNENGREYSYMSNGVIMHIELEVFVPRGQETRIEAKYGLVEVKDFQATLTVDAKYGGVDATISPAHTGELLARTRYGEILSNLDVKFDNDWGRDADHWTEISAKIGTGSRYSLESKYGKVYLRKPL
jgi:hypothetical protein